MTFKEFKELIEYIKKHDCIPMATPFDEKSVDWCVDLRLPIIKIASSDINDWILIKKIASTKIPVILSTGGANDKQVDDVVNFFINTAFFIDAVSDLMLEPKSCRKISINFHIVLNIHSVSTVKNV